MLFYYHYYLIHFYRLKKALPRHGNIPASIVCCINRTLPAQDPPDPIITETGAEVQRFMSENSCHSAVTSPSAGGFMAQAM